MARSDNNGLRLLAKLDTMLQVSRRSKPSNAALENFRDFVSISRTSLVHCKVALNGEGNVILYFKKNEHEMTIPGTNFGEIHFSESNITGFYDGVDITATDVKDLNAKIYAIYRQTIANEMEERRARLLNNSTPEKEEEDEHTAAE